MPDLSFQGIKNALLSLLGQSEGEDAVAMLMADHRRVKEIFDSFKDLDDEEKMAAMHKALVELALHAACEEKLVYPLLREEGESEKEEVDESVEEHHLMKVLMRELEMMSGVNDRLKAKFKVLGEIVQHHVEEEEHDMFPKLRSADDIDLHELGQKIAERKEELLAKLGEENNLGIIDPELMPADGHGNGNGNGKAKAEKSEKQTGKPKASAQGKSKSKKASSGVAARKTASKTVSKSGAKTAAKKPAAKKPKAKAAADKKKAPTAKKVTKPAAKKSATTRAVAKAPKAKAKPKAAVKKPAAGAKKAGAKKSSKI